MVLWQWAIRKHARACTGTIATLWGIAMPAEDILSVVDSGQVVVRYFVRIGVTRVRMRASGMGWIIGFIGSSFNKLGGSS